MNQAILKAQSYAIEAQEREMSQTSRIRTLEEEVGRLTNWNIEKENYELKAVGGAGFAYVRRQAAETSEPTFWLCQPCFENAKKSVMQMKTHMELGYGVWACPVCDAEMRVAAGTFP